MKRKNVLSLSLLFLSLVLLVTMGGPIGCSQSQHITTITRADSTLTATLYSIGWRSYTLYKLRVLNDSTFVEDWDNDGGYNSKLDEVRFQWEGKMVEVHGDGGVLLNDVSINNEAPSFKRLTEALNSLAKEKFNIITRFSLTK